MHDHRNRWHGSLIAGLAFAVALLSSSVALAQGSIYGTVSNADLSTPANGEITFFGYLDNTDEEIRLEVSVGAGYDAGNWFDDFQNYLTEAPGNPYDYHFYNSANGQGFVLSKAIPNNSFQQEDIQLTAVGWPLAPDGLSGQAISPSTVVISWNSSPGSSYHVYRRLGTSNGSFFRKDDPTGSLANHGVTTNYFVDNTVDGVNEYDYLIVADDGGGVLSPHSAILTVNSSIVTAPVVDAITPNTGYTSGGLPITITGSGFDPSGATATIGGNPVTSVVVVSPFEITGLTPAGVGGAADVFVTNAASAMASSPLVGGFTYVANTAPVLAAIGPQSVAEGANLNLPISATDADGDSLIFSAHGVPTNATFNDNYDGTAIFDFNPDFTQAGTYFVTFVVTDGLEADSETVQVDVTEAGNQAPVLAAIGSQSVTEGQNLNFNVTATDAEGDSLIFSANGVPTNATFTDNYDGSGTFNFNPDFTQAGTYFVSIIVSDGIDVDSEVVQIDVLEFGNHAPVLANIGTRFTTEGTTLNFNVSATDIDADSLIFSANGVPTNATFTDNYNGTGTFDFTPDFTQAGTYFVSFIVSDGVDVDSEVVEIDVYEAGNQAPVLAAIGSQSVTEGMNLNLTLSATEPDGDSIIFSAVGVPTNATFADHYDGTATFDFNPDFSQAGSYQVIFIASDGAAADSETVQIDVLEAGNQAPILAAIGAQSLNEGDSLGLAISAADPEADTVILSAAGMPANATFADNFDGTGLFIFKPDFTQSGSYQVTFIASDGVDADSEIVQIDVLESGNQAPVLATIGSRTVTELDNLNFMISASDPDLDALTLTAENLPSGATFNDNTDGTGTFDFTPTVGQHGTYPVTFIASDGVLADTEIVSIQVIEFENQAPVFDPVVSDTIKEGHMLTILLHATDDADIPYFDLITDLEGYTFVDSGNGYATFQWTPDYYDAGVDTVRFVAFDNYTPPLAVFMDVEIVVLDANWPPQMTVIDTLYVNAGNSAAFRVVATDSTDYVPGTLFLSATEKPTGSVFTDSGGGIGGFRWSTTIADTGWHRVRLLCLDNDTPVMSDRDTVWIDVVPVNQAPVLAEIGPQSVLEGDTLEIAVSATDPDGTIPLLFVNNLPRRAAFADNSDGTGTFLFVPDFQQAGLVQPKFTASDGSLQDYENVLIQVVNVPQPPILTVPAETLEVMEGDTLQFLISATDADSTIPYLEVDTTLISLISSFTDSANGVGLFEFDPLYIHAGLWDITFFALDDDSTSDTAVVTIRVLDAGNQMPIITSPLDGVTLQTTELADLNFTVKTTDADSVPPLISISGLPSGATFTDNGNYTATFSWMDIPNLTAGDYPMTIYANDGEQPADVDSVHITVHVADYNYKPDLIFFNPFTVCIGNDCSMGLNEGDTASFQFYSGDVDGVSPFMVGWQYSIEVDTVYDTLVFTPPVEVDTSIVSDTTYLPLPPNMEVTDLSNDTADFIFAPDYTQAGTYRVFLMALDAADTTLYQVVRFTFTVTNVPMSPILDPIGSQAITEGDTLNILIHGYDPDGNSVTIFAEGLPPGASFTIVQAGTATNRLFYNPDFDAAGTYNTLFFVRENSFPYEADSEYVTITVADAGPQAPIITSPTTQVYTLSQTDSLKVWIQSYDPDGGTPTLSVAGDPEVPYNAVFVDSANGNGSFRFAPMPNHTDSSWTVLFIASDGTQADTVSTAISVISFVAGDANGDGFVNVTDAVYIILWIFAGGPGPDPYAAGDADGSGTVNISDASYLIQFIFADGPPPVE